MKPSVNIFRRNLRPGNGPGRGFTLVEMLAVIVILAILVTLGVRIGAYVRDEGKRKTTRAVQSIVMNAISKFHELFDVYPTDGGDKTTGGVPLLRILKDNPDLSSPADNTLLNQVFGHIPISAELQEINNKIKTSITPKLSDLPKETLKGGDTAFRDGWGNAMQYSVNEGPGGTPVLISAGNDGNFGTEDDIRSSDSQ